MEELCIERGVGTLRGGKVGNGELVGRKDSKDGRVRLGAKGKAEASRGGVDGGGDARYGGGHLRVGAEGVEFGKDRIGGGHGNGVAGEGTGLVDVAGGSELVHDFRACAEGREGEAAADDFAHGDDVGGNVGLLAVEAVVETEGVDDFVADEECAVGVGHRLEAAEVTVVRRDATHIAGDGFEDDGGDLAGVGGEGALCGGEVVVGDDEGVGGDAKGDAGAGDFGAVSCGEGAATGTHKESVAVPVVATFTLEDEFAAGEAACEADGGHHGLGAGVDEADFIDEGDAVDEALGELDFAGGANAKGGAACGGLGNGFGDAGMGVAEDHRAPGTTAVDELAAIGEGNVGAFAGGDVNGGAANGIEGAYRGVDAAGNDTVGALKEGIVVHRRPLGIRGQRSRSRPRREAWRRQRDLRGG